jgi:hypothetical protein
MPKSGAYAPICGLLPAFAIPFNKNGESIVKADISSNNNIKKTL